MNSAFISFQVTSHPPSPPLLPPFLFPLFLAIHYIAFFSSLFSIPIFIVFPDIPLVPISPHICYPAPINSPLNPLSLHVFLEFHNSPPPLRIACRKPRIAVNTLSPSSLPLSPIFLTSPLLLLLFILFRCLILIGKQHSC